MLIWTRTLHLLPIAAVAWMAIAARFIFASDAGRRDPRGYGIAASLWATLGANLAGTTPPPLVSAIGVAGLLLALAIFHWAALSIRGRLFSFAANDDVPQFIHTAGPYRYVRNPFYASYLLAGISMVVMAPGVWGVVAIVASVAYFQWLARFEEEKFARSPVATEFRLYKDRTGRLLPRIF